MTTDAALADLDPLRKLLTQQELVRVAVIDDAFDPIERQEIRPDETTDLWAQLEFNEEALAEIAQLDLKVSCSGDLTNVLIAEILRRRSEFPQFGTVWDQSTIGQRLAANIDPLNRLIQHLNELTGLEVLKFGNSTPTEQLLEKEPQLLFLDWYLGGDTSAAIQSAVEKAKGILGSWPAGHPKPLIVLMSSHQDLCAHADEFCRGSKILRGMFYAVLKNELTDLFKLRMYMRLFAMSLPAGRRLQQFMDELRDDLKDVSEKFADMISELTLNDYAYIQGLSLQKDGQPLGDYLLWLFSAYYGQLLFAEALHDRRADLDTMTFTEALPVLGPPSNRLTEIYHSAIFDTSVGPIGSHPRAGETPDTGVEANQPILTFGDVLERGNSTRKQDAAAGAMVKNDRAIDARESEDSPDMYMVMNAQCDLVFTPDSGARKMDSNRSILLLPGYLQPILEPSSDSICPKTELYWKDGLSYRINWDTKHLLTLRYKDFTAWQAKEGYERVRRLRLPFALEVQRSFASDLTRIGMPVMPPICQPVTVQVLRTITKDDKRIYTEAAKLLDNETAFLMLTRDGQQYVLTQPIAMRLKLMLDDRLKEMNGEQEADVEASKKKHLPEQIEALRKAIATDHDWYSVMLPFSLSLNGSKMFLGNHIQIVREKKDGDFSDSNIKTIVTVSLNIGGTIK